MIEINVLLFIRTVAMAKLFESIGKLGLALAIGGGVVNSALFNGKFSGAQLLKFCVMYLIK